MRFLVVVNTVDADTTRLTSNPCRPLYRRRLRAVPACLLGTRRVLVRAVLAAFASAHALTSSAVWRSSALCTGRIRPCRCVCVDWRSIGMSNQPLFVKPDQAFAVSAPEIQFHVLLRHSGRAFSLAVINRVACAAPVGAKQVIHFDRKALAKPNSVRVAPNRCFLIAVADANNADRATLASRGFAYLAH